MISFVIPAHNEEAYLPATLAALGEAAEALAEAYEIIVVDDASTDGTAAVAASAGARVHGVCLRQISRVRNAGAAVAAGDKLVFIDADTTVGAEVLLAACRALDYEAVGGGARVGMDVELTPTLRLAMAVWNTLSRTTRWAAGCFIFVRRQAFFDAGGFSEELFAAEEIDLSEKLKRFGPFVILPQCVTTSARKLESHTVGHHLALFGRTVLSRGRVLKGREGLGLWYEVRDDEREG